MANPSPDEIYAMGVLSEEHHERIVADLDNFARDAGIQPKFIYSPMLDMCEQVETYLRRFKFHTGEGLAGLCFTKRSHLPVPPDHYMSAIAGALTRNFIRAKVMTLGSVIDACASHSMPNVTCLLIPNFFYPQSEGGTIASWQVSALHDLLVSRQVNGQQTIVYASDVSLLAKEYGLAFGEMIDVYYTAVEN